MEQCVKAAEKTEKGNKSLAGAKKKTVLDAGRPARNRYGTVRPGSRLPEACTGCPLKDNNLSTEVLN